MSLLLRAIDVFKAAILLEQRGAKFYLEAAHHAEGKGKDLLTRLAKMEEGHVKKFTDLLKAYDAKSAANSCSEDEKAFLEALTSDRIITRECVHKEGDDLETILEKAMLLEKNAVFFYSAVKDTLKEKMGIDGVNQIIVEEIGHFRMLNKALADLNSSEETS